MKTAKLHARFMQRGDAKSIDHELGLQTNGRTARRWCREVRPEHGADSTGRPSPVVRAKAELLATDKVRPQLADVLLFELHASLQIQRARQSGLKIETDGRKIAVALIESVAEAVKAVLGLVDSQEQRETAMALAGGTILRARMFVEGDSPDGEPNAATNQAFKIAA